MRRTLAILVTAAAASAGAVTVGAAPAQAAPTQAATTSWPAHYSAPYVDISLYPQFNLPQAAQDGGSRYYTLAFVLNGGGSCNAAWSNSSAIDSGFLAGDIATLRSMGGDVAISVGGANGTEPAASCASPGDLQAQYQRIVDAYQLTHLDFDVEGGALSDTATVDRRNKAITGLEAANPDLQVSYTLPVLPSALTQPGIDLLQNAVTNGTRVDVVNMMTMDYGAANSDMGGAATGAATALVDQLRGIFTGRSDTQLWSMVGITPMIGQNDSPGEVFSQSDATNVISFAQAHGVTQLAFWSAGRDNGGCANQTYASPSCSGLAQDQWAFMKQFGAFTDGGGAPTSPPTTPACGNPYSNGSVYLQGDVVSYGGHKWTAKWWTQNETPGTSDVWTDDGAC